MSGWVPSIDWAETKDSYVVKAEIPGMEAKDIDISLQGDILTLRGEKKQELDWALKGRRFFKWRTCFRRPFLPSGAGSCQQGNILFR